ncbi:hypothetical protein [Parerythrobacter aestuarii]|uniref:hypothetical protein n=1 Tax=Parerythrobacter aestuarii TaxID=3020909 RepID=UPI0024DED015|nr:hypothetical protein [Parerythrobacter aestuarii]
MKRFLTLATGSLLLVSAAAMAQNRPDDTDGPGTDGTEGKTPADGQELARSVLDGTEIAQQVGQERAWYFVPRHKRGQTLAISEDVVSRLCGDFDGCQVRIGMYNWDGTGRIASRETLLYYNASNKNWRASLGDRAGSNRDNTTQHINKSWSCYFTDGTYSGFKNLGDTDLNFGLMSWNQYNAGCLLTIID